MNTESNKILIVWRKRTSIIDHDNQMLAEWFQKNRISTRDFDYYTIYVNGSNNLPNLRPDYVNWKVGLIEGGVVKRMWNMGEV